MVSDSYKRAEDSPRKSRKKLYSQGMANDLSTKVLWMRVRLPLKTNPTPTTTGYSLGTTVADTEYVFSIRYVFKKR